MLIYNLKNVEKLYNYLESPDRYVFDFVIKQKNGKERTIITYKDNDLGKELRDTHERILRYIKYKSSNYSFAYKKGISCLDAVKDHLKSNWFLKIDIKDFFPNISLQNFLNLYGSNFDSRWTILLKSCFYNNSLSLGYVTSPMISDYYLSSFDFKVEEFIKNNPNLKLHYSRYCDDILISTENDVFTDLERLYAFIRFELERYHLSINERKTIKAKLEANTNNAIPFLGLNISKDKKGFNKVTISKNFIVTTLDLLDLYYKNSNKRKNRLLRSNILSRIAYIKNSSGISYKRFLKKHINRFNKKYIKI